MENKKPIIAFFDIETSPLKISAWKTWEADSLRVEEEWYILSFAVKLGDSATKVYSLNQFKSEKELVKKLWEYMDLADIVCGHNCVSTDTKILTSDLRYVDAGTLKVGDTLVGFDENIPGPNKRRRYKHSIVTDFSIKKLPALRITLSDGSSIKVTHEHKFLVPRNRGNGANWSWKMASELKIGDTLTRVMKEWDTDDTYKGGYLAGVYDGEGCLSYQTHLNKESGNGIIRLGCAQKENELKEHTLRYLSDKGFIATKSIDNGADKKYSTVWRWNISGVSNCLRFLGSIRPKRLLSKLDVNNIGSVQYSLDGRTTIVSIETIGEIDIAVISTSTKTYISNGFASHNCDKFDIKKSNARFMFHGFLPPSPYKTIDTLKVARRYFAFTSNRLDALGEYLGVGRKVKHEGMDLWFSCMKGDEKAFSRMRKYNKQDVDLLYAVYNKLKPYMVNHPSMTIYQELTGCPTCTSSKLQSRGFGVTKTGKYRRFHCQECGAWSRGKTIKTEVEIVN